MSDIKEILELIKNEQWEQRALIERSNNTLITSINELNDSIKELRTKINCLR